jgi:hypothetical protein
MLQGPFLLWRPDLATLQATNLAHFMSEFQVAALTLSTGMLHAAAAQPVGVMSSVDFPTKHELVSATF